VSLSSPQFQTSTAKLRHYLSGECTQYLFHVNTAVNLITWYAGDYICSSWQFICPADFRDSKKGYRVERFYSTLDPRSFHLWKEFPPLAAVRSYRSCASSPPPPQFGYKIPTKITMCFHIVEGIVPVLSNYSVSTNALNLTCFRCHMAFWSTKLNLRLQPFPFVNVFKRL
jgi:hypothetical protein